MTHLTEVYLTSRQVRERYGVTSMTLYRWTKNKSVCFPAPVKLGMRRCYWPLSALLQWEAERRGTEAA